MKYLIEKSNYYNIGDEIIIEYWYNDMITVCKITEKVGRKYKITHNIEESKIQNAPDEVINSSDIIDKYKNKKSHN